jgi:hypothetical protein
VGAVKEPARVDGVGLAPGLCALSTGGLEVKTWYNLYTVYVTLLTPDSHIRRLERDLVIPLEQQYPRGGLSKDRTEEKAHERSDFNFPEYAREVQDVLDGVEASLAPALAQVVDEIRGKL